jgi:hypothetical protein
MEHIATLEENLRKFSETEAGVSSVLEENAQLKEELRQRQREHETTIRASEDLQQQLAQSKQRVQKLEEEVTIEKVRDFTPKTLFFFPWFSSLLFAPQTTINELSSKLKENREERQQLVESFEDTLEQKLTELREEHEQAKVI